MTEEQIEVIRIPGVHCENCGAQGVSEDAIKQVKDTNQCHICFKIGKELGQSKFVSYCSPT